MYDFLLVSANACATMGTLPEHPLRVMAGIECLRYDGDPPRGVAFARLRVPLRFSSGGSSIWRLLIGWGEYGCPLASRVDRLYQGHRHRGWTNCTTGVYYPNDRSGPAASQVTDRGITFS